MRQVAGLSPNGEMITLKRFTGLNFPKKELTAPLSDQNTLAIYLDVETTGTDRLRDNIIDLGYILFEYDRRSGQIHSIKKVFSHLQDPKEPISPEVQRLTGINDQMVKNQEIPWNEVVQDFELAQIILSHNAAFDRAFLDRMVPLSREKVWGCSLAQVDWRGKGHGTSALEYLCKDHGFFFQGHRALVDVEAALHLLSFIDPDTRQTYLGELLGKARVRMKWVYAHNAAFHFKDVLKERGYIWDGTKKVWKISVPIENQEEEAFLEAKRPDSGTAVSEPLALKDTFKTYL